MRIRDLLTAGSFGLATALLALGAHPVFAGEDWAQWRGPERDGDGEAFGDVAAWPGEPEVIWDVAVGEGQASPLVVGDRVVLFDRVDGNERVWVGRLDTGETLWQREDPVRFKPGMGGGHHGAGPKATPLVSGEWLVTFGVTSLLTARRFDDGELVWRRDLAEEVRDPTLYWGNSMSPIVIDGRVVVQYGNRKNGGVRAYDLRTGELGWFVEGYGSSYSSPVLAGEGDDRHLVLMTYEGLVGLNGEGKVLWQSPLPMSFSRQNVATPVVSGHILVHTGDSRPLRADRLENSGSGWSLSRLWEREDLPHDLSSPIAFDNRLCGFTQRNKGQLFCVDLDSGSDLWRGPARSGEFAVLLVTPQFLLVAHAEGRLVVLDRAATSYSPVVEYELANSETWAHPAVLPGGLVVKSHDRLRRLSFVDVP